jgi:hypothetical protein
MSYILTYDGAVGQAQEESGSFLKKRTKKLLGLGVNSS